MAAGAASRRDRSRSHRESRPRQFAGVGPKSSSSQESSGEWSIGGAPSRTAAEPGAVSGSGEASDDDEGVVLGSAEADAASLLLDVGLPLDEVELALEGGDVGGGGGVVEAGAIRLGGDRRGVSHLAGEDDDDPGDDDRAEEPGDASLRDPGDGQSVEAELGSVSTSGIGVDVVGIELVVEVGRLGPVRVVHLRPMVAAGS